MQEVFSLPAGLLRLPVRPGKFQKGIGSAGRGKFAGGKKEKKAIAETIKKAEESVEAMNVARKSMLKYNSSFAEGLQT